MPGSDRQPDVKRWLFAGRGRAVAHRYARQAGATCALCDRPVLYRAGRKGYCRAHKPEADRHMARLNANLSRKEQQRTYEDD